MDEHTESDGFWDDYLPQPNPIMLDYNFLSLADATEQAHLIVRGHVTDVYVGEHWMYNEDEPPSPLAYARVSITEVLKGEPQSRVEGTVEVQLSDVGDDWDPMRVAPPLGEENLFFLMHEATVRSDRGQPARDYSEIAPFAYFIPSPQAVLRNVDGKVWVIGPEVTSIHYGEDGFPMTLHGSDFESLVEDVRQAAN